MLRHIGVHIFEESEVHDFYEQVLGFTKIKTYIFYPDAALKLFGEERLIPIHRMQRFEVILELFVCPVPFTPGVSHMALEYWQANQIIEKARKANYTVVEFEKRTGKKGYFIKDKAGNIFEIKEINLV
ncbi:MAG: VOC family protein [Bacteroidales bacterium]|nr:VOC family protein [Bacteroidales bacterium]